VSDRIGDRTDSSLHLHLEHLFWPSIKNVQGRPSDRPLLILELAAMVAIREVAQSIEPHDYLSKSVRSNKPSATPIPQSTYGLNGEYIHNILIRVIDVSCVRKEGN
jgi:hypothetical protein